MTRVLILGGTGMFGHKAYQRLSLRFETFVTMRRFDDALRGLGIFEPGHVIDGVDAQQMDSIRSALDRAAPDCVLNCIGIIKQRPQASEAIPSICVNALFPHRLADLCAERGVRLIHLSTDCVFSGRQGHYVETDEPDATDLYGRTKQLGEVGGAGVITLRTSMIGRELRHGASLVEWFLGPHDAGAVKGFTRAIFSGLTTTVLATEIGRLIADFPTLSGLYHLSADPISKYDLLWLLREAYAVAWAIEPDSTFECDRSLRSDRYRSATGFVPPDWPTMIEAMARDVTT